MKNLIKTVLSGLTQGVFKPEKKSFVSMKNILDEWVAQKGFCESDMPLEAVAEQLGVRRETLSSFCIRNYGAAFLSWRKRLRIEEAKRIMLEDKNLSFSIVGEMVGIPDRSNFRKQFIDETGMTPNEWKKQHTGLGLLN